MLRSRSRYTLTENKFFSEFFSELSILDFRERLKVGGETEGCAILRQNKECSEMGEGHVSHVGHGYVHYMEQPSGLCTRLCLWLFKLIVNCDPAWSCEQYLSISISPVVRNLPK